MYIITFILDDKKEKVKVLLSLFVIDSYYVLIPPHEPASPYKNPEAATNLKSDKKNTSL